MKKTSLFLVSCALGAALFMAGCSMTVPVRGQFQSGAVKFSGQATGYMGGSGVLHVTTTDGIVCDGDFVYVNYRQGEGTFVCSDGRSGPFSFVSSGRSGTGTGIIGDEPITFTFGK